MHGGRCRGGMGVLPWLPAARPRPAASCTNCTTVGRAAPRRRMARRSAPRKGSSIRWARGAPRRCSIIERLSRDCPLARRSRARLAKPPPSVKPLRGSNIGAWVQRWVQFGRVSGRQRPGLSCREGGGSSGSSSAVTSMGGAKRPRAWRSLMTMTVVRASTASCGPVLGGTTVWSA